MTKTEQLNEYKATLYPSGSEFKVLPGQSLLDAGLSSGIALPYGCANGSCGDCRARLRDGQVAKNRQHEFVLTEAQKRDKQFLMCSNSTLSDVVVEVFEASSVRDIPIQNLQAKPCRSERHDGVDLLAFKFVRGKVMRFLPGQHAVLSLKDESKLALPIASCPCNAHSLEFHLPRSLYSSNTTESEFVEKLLLSVDSRERVTVTGPIGDFTLTSDNQRPKLFIATGGDFAQLQGLIEQVFNRDLGTPCCLVWLATAEVKHYRSNLCRSWHDAIDEFTFVPVENCDEALAQLPSPWQSMLTQCEVYMGSEQVKLIQELKRRGVEDKDILYPSNAVSPI